MPMNKKGRKGATADAWVRTFRKKSTAKVASAKRGTEPIQFWDSAKKKNRRRGEKLKNQTVNPQAHVPKENDCRKKCGL